LATIDGRYKKEIDEVQKANVALHDDLGDLQYQISKLYESEENEPLRRLTDHLPIPKKNNSEENESPIKRKNNIMNIPVPRADQDNTISEINAAKHRRYGLRSPKKKTLRTDN